MTGSGNTPTAAESRQVFFRELAHQVHLGRCTRWPFGDCCPRHEDGDYFTPKDNDIASTVLHWLERQHITPWRSGE